MTSGWMQTSTVTSDFLVILRRYRVPRLGQKGDLVDGEPEKGMNLTLREGRGKECNIGVKKEIFFRCLLNTLVMGP